MYAFLTLSATSATRFMSKPGASWPERVRGLVSVSCDLIGNLKANAKSDPAAAEFAWWYQSYLCTDRGRDGYAADPVGFNRFTWQQASPRWKFDDAVYLRSAQAFGNPDHVAVVVHNYRWRVGLVQEETRFDAIEARLATASTIAVPPITMEGDANSAPHPAPAVCKSKLTGKYQHRQLEGAIGHTCRRKLMKPLLKPSWMCRNCTALPLLRCIGRSSSDRAKA